MVCATIPIYPYRLLKQFLINKYKNYQFAIPAKHVLTKVGRRNPLQISNTWILLDQECLKEQHFINTITINFDTIY